MTKLDITNLKDELRDAKKMADKAITDANTTHQEIKKEMSEIKDQLNDLKVDIASLPEKLAEKFDQRYASKKHKQVFYLI